MKLLSEELDNLSKKPDSLKQEKVIELLLDHVCELERKLKEKEVI